MFGMLEDFISSWVITNKHDYVKQITKSEAGR